MRRIDLDELFEAVESGRTALPIFLTPEEFDDALADARINRKGYMDGQRVMVDGGYGSEPLPAREWMKLHPKARGRRGRRPQQSSE